MKTIEQSLQEFHKAFNLALGNDFKEDALLQLRERLIDEEYNELKEAIHNIVWAMDDCARLDPPRYNKQQLDNFKEHVLKEAVDLVYVVVGMCVAYGWCFDEAFKRVHESNMSKLDMMGNAIYDKGGKVLKGPNYKPANLEGLV